MTHIAINDVIYGRKYGMGLCLDIIKPPKPSGVGVIGLSSGGWRSFPEMGKPQPEAFLARGQTVFLVCHGARPRFYIPEIVQDISRAIRFVKTHAAEHAVDPKRLGLFGISSGGNISLLTAAQAGMGDPEAKDPIDREDSRVGAVATFYPPTDLQNFGKPGKTWLPYRPPDGPSEDAYFTKAYSPVTHFTEKMPPVLIIHGDADELVPVQQAHAAAERLKALGVEHRIEIRPDKPHGWPGMEGEYALCAEWFDKHLRG